MTVTRKNSINNLIFDSLIFSDNLVELLGDCNGRMIARDLIITLINRGCSVEILKSIENEAKPKGSYIFMYNIATENKIIYKNSTTVWELTSKGIERYTEITGNSFSRNPKAEPVCMDCKIEPSASTTKGGEHVKTNYCKICLARRKHTAIHHNEPSICYICGDDIPENNRHCFDCIPRLSATPSLTKQANSNHNSGFNRTFPSRLYYPVKKGIHGRRR